MAVKRRSPLRIVRRLAGLALLSIAAYLGAAQAQSGAVAAQPADRTCKPASQILAGSFRPQPAGRMAFALLMGSNYEHFGTGGPVQKLNNGINDAETMASLLRARGYATICMTDPTGQQIKDAVWQLRTLLLDLQDLGKRPRALIYFAGHGGNVDGVPSLVTSELVPPTVGGRVPTLPVVELRALIPGTHNATILVVDACRTDVTNEAQFVPFRSEAELPKDARKQEATPVYSVYTTAASSSAGDGAADAKNGLFVTALAKHLREAWDHPVDPRIGPLVHGALTALLSDSGQRPHADVGGIEAGTEYYFWPIVEPPRTDQEFIALMWVGSLEKDNPCSAWARLKTYADGVPQDQSWLVHVRKRLRELENACAADQAAIASLERLPPDMQRLARGVLTRQTLDSTNTRIKPLGGRFSFERGEFNKGDFRLRCDLGTCDREKLVVESGGRLYSIKSTDVSFRPTTRYRIPVERSTGWARGAQRDQVVSDLALDRRAFAAMTVWIIDPKSTPSTTGDDASIFRALSDLQGSTLAHFVQAGRLPERESPTVLTEIDLRQLPSGLGELFLPEMRKYCEPVAASAPDDLCMIVELTASGATGESDNSR